MQGIFRESRHFPVLNPKTRNSAKFCSVVGYQSQTVDPRNGCNLHVIRANRVALAFKVSANLSVIIGSQLVEGQAKIGCEHCINLAPILSRLFAFQAINIQLTAVIAQTRKSDG